MLAGRASRVVDAAARRRKRIDVILEVRPARALASKKQADEHWQDRASVVTRSVL